MTTLTASLAAALTEEAVILGLRQAARITRRSDEHRLLDLCSQIADIEGSTSRDVWVRLTETNVARVARDSRPADPWSDMP